MLKPVKGYIKKKNKKKHGGTFYLLGLTGLQQEKYVYILDIFYRSQDFFCKSVRLELGKKVKAV